MNTIFFTREDHDDLLSNNFAAETIQIIKKYILKKTNLKVLDLGCGAGEYLICLKNENDQMYRYEKLVGVDNLSQEIYGICHPKELSTLGIDFCESDVFTFLGYHNDLYDLIICSNLLHFFPYEQILKLMKKSNDLLNDGGIMYIKMANGNHKYSEDSSKTVFDDSFLDKFTTEFNIETIYYLEKHVILIIKN